jgi:hypothetical protein
MASPDSPGALAGRSQIRDLLVRRLFAGVTPSCPQASRNTRLVHTPNTMTASLYGGTAAGFGAQYPVSRPGNQAVTLMKHYASGSDLVEPGDW